MRVACLILAFAVACTGPALPAPPSPHYPPAAVGKSAGPIKACGAQPTVMGRVQETELNEISGVVESRRAPGVFLVHNDSGDSPRLFAINLQGELLAELQLETVPILIDAEDIALGPAPGSGWFVYLGDTGNNFASMGVGIPRRKAVLHRFAEPELAAGWRGAQVPIRDVYPIVLTFPDGARDVEAFVIDPLSGDLFMIGKQFDGRSQIFSASADTLAAGGGELRVELELVFGRGDLPGSTMPTAAAISRDGRSIVIRTYSAAFLFRRQPGEALPAALRRTPRQLPTAREQQGEALGFAHDDAAFVTISEGVKPAIYCTLLPQASGPIR
jgi:hypothetical protein